MWRLLSREILLDNRWISVKKDKVELSNGVVVDDFYSVTIPNAVAIVAFDNKGNIILKKEYRYAADEMLIELPTGMFEPEETDGLEVAKRELLEETGYISDDWEYFGDTVESSSKLTNRMHIFFAQNCVKVAEQKLDRTEELEVMIVPISEAIDMVMRNEIKCNSSAHGILKAVRMTEKQ